MFTGLIEEIGTIISISNSGKSLCLSISARQILKGLNIGDSVSTNGVCLTVTDKNDSAFSADVMNETIQHTNFKSFRLGESVNLERAMIVGDRFGGHVVSGHVDGIGTISEIRKDGIATLITIKAPPQLMKYVIQKGSIAVDGVSLTVAAIRPNAFSISLIPHTFHNTVFSQKRLLSTVNLETDLFAKYAEKFIQRYAVYSEFQHKPQFKY